MQTNRLLIVPDNASAFIDRVIDDCRLLIDTGVWSGIKINDLDIWLRNFKDDAEMYFAACVLDKLIYRNQQQVAELVRFLFQRTLPDLLRFHKISELPDDNLEGYFKNKRPENCPVRFVAVMKNSDDVSSSSSVILRVFKHEFKINENFFISPKNIEDAVEKKGVRLIIFIDDIVGSGKQFNTFISNSRLKKAMQKAFFVYTPLIAHQKGIDAIKQSHSAIKVASVERLDDRHNMFAVNCDAFSENGNTPSNAKLFYENLLQKRNIKCGEDKKFGMGGLALTFLFYYGAPNNSLPIFWYSENGWNPLIKR